MADLLRARLGLGAEESDQLLIHANDTVAAGAGDTHDTDSLLDYEPDEDDEEDEIIFADDEDGADAAGSVTENEFAAAAGTGRPDSRSVFKTPECFIKTTATIVVTKKDTGPDPDRPTLEQIRNRPQLVYVPPSRMKQSLSKRFEEQNVRKMKRDLTQEQALLNYLRFKGDAGFSKVFSGTAAAKAKLAERMKLIQESGAKMTMHDKFLLRQADDHFDHEAFWREQVALWIMKYEWRKRDGPEVSKDELDREIEEWMAKRGEFATTDEMEQDFTSFMNRRGYDREAAEQLDHDMDDYWAKKGLTLPQTDDDTDDTSTVTSVQTAGSRRRTDYNEADLDNDLDEYLKKRGTASSVTSEDMDTDSVTTGSQAYSSLRIPNRRNVIANISNNDSGNKQLTPQQRMRAAAANRAAFEAAVAKKEAGASDAEVLNQELEAYMTTKRATDQQIKQEEEEQRKKQQQEQLNANPEGDGDRFADCPDFEDDDDEVEWQT